MEPQNLVAGVCVGLLVGLTGVGGGSLMTPILVLLFGVAPGIAVGTDLWFAAITKLVGGALHSTRGNVDWQVVRRLCLGSLTSAIATVLILRVSGGGHIGGGAMVTTLGVMLVLTATAMIFKTQLHAFGRRLRLGSTETFKAWQPVGTVVAGAVLGVLVTLTSVGAGALCAVLLTSLYPLRMTPRKLVATDLVHAIPLTAVAGTGYLLMGNVDGGRLVQLLAGSIPGVLIGAHFSDSAPEKVLRPLIAVVLVLVGFRLVLS